jgi:hypothetical protein
MFLNGVFILKILNVTYSETFRDPRVLRQIKWLQESGATVDVLGLGPRPNLMKGKYFEIHKPNVLFRIFIYLFASSRSRQKRLINRQVPWELEKAIASGQYNIVHLNDLEFVPWLDSLIVNKKTNNVRFQRIIDLHEYFPGVKGGLIWNFINFRYHKWLIKRFRKSTFDTYSTVSEEIAETYCDRFELPEFEVVWNAPEFKNHAFVERTKDKIDLVYHGNAGKGRPLLRYIRAVSKSSGCFNLNFMINASFARTVFLKLYVKMLGIEDRVFWHETVAVNEIVSAITKFDAQLVWFPPSSENMNLSLGNKFFESIQGHLALISGNSPSMLAIIGKYNLGSITRGWKTQDLIAALDELTRDRVEIYRKNSFTNAKILSEDTSRVAFLNKVINASL